MMALLHRSFRRVEGALLLCGERLAGHRSRFRIPIVGGALSNPETIKWTPFGWPISLAIATINSHLPLPVVFIASQTPSRG